MGKGGGSPPPAPSSQTVTQTNLPEYAKPYFENLLNRTQAESYRQYTPYKGERLAGFTPEQQGIQAEVAGMQQPGQFAAATNLASTAGLGSIAAGQYAPGTFGAANIQAPGLSNIMIGGPQQVGTGGIQAAQMAAPQQFDAAVAQHYMSPYMQQVVDVQKQEAIRDAQQAQKLVNLGAARQGSYGGARQLLGQTEASRNLGQQLAQIQATGTQAAYEQAQQQFERDRAAGMQATLANLSNEQQARVQSEANRLQAQGMNQEAALRTALANQQAGLGVQELGARQSMEAQAANQQAALEAQRMREQSRQFGGTLGLQGLAQAGQMAGLLSDIGTAGQQAQIQRLSAQEASAAQQQALEQQRLDMAYADFLRQRDYPMEQLGYYSNILRGLPIQLGSTATTYAQPPSLLSQAGGLGIGALGLSNLLGRG